MRRDIIESRYIRIGELDLAPVIDTQTRCSGNRDQCICHVFIIHNQGTIYVQIPVIARCLQQLPADAFLQRHRLACSYGYIRIQQHFVTARQGFWQSGEGAVSQSAGNTDIGSFSRCGDTGDGGHTAPVLQENRLLIRQDDIFARNRTSAGKSNLRQGNVLELHIG